MGLRLELVVSLYNQNNFDSLIEVVEKAKRKGEIAPNYVYYLGLAYMQKKNFGKALKNLDIVVKSNISNDYIIQCKILKAFVFTALDEFDQAKVELTNLLKEGHETSIIHGALGHVYFKIQDENTAILHLRKSLELDPNNISALNSLSFVLADTNQNLDEAMDCIEKVLKEDPRNPVYLDTYGYVLYKQGNLVDAKRILEFAYKIEANVTIREHLELLNETQKV